MSLNGVYEICGCCSINMWKGIILKIFVFLLLIYGIHTFWNYLKDNFTEKKVKDLVNIQVEKYKQMLDEMQENKSFPLSPLPLSSVDQDMIPQLLLPSSPEQETNIHSEDMENELYAFLQSQIQNSG